jgi:hypothetical protein
LSDHEATIADLVASNVARVDSLRRQRNWLLVAVAVLAVTVVVGIAQVHDYGKRIDKGVTTIIDGRQTRRIACEVLRNQGGADPSCDGLLDRTRPATAPASTNRLICDLEQQLHDSLGLVNVSQDCPPL